MENQNKNLSEADKERGSALQKQKEFNENHNEDVTADVSETTLNDSASRINSGGSNSEEALKGGENMTNNVGAGQTEKQEMEGERRLKKIGDEKEKGEPADEGSIDENTIAQGRMPLDPSQRTVI